MKTVITTNINPISLRIKFIYEKGHKFHGQVYTYANDSRQGYRQSIESLNKWLKEEDKIKIPE